MPKKRLIAVAAGVLVALAGAGLLTLFSNLNSLIAATIEKHGSAATGTRVAVSGVDVSLRKGSGAIAGLRVASPGGYKADDAFRLEGIVIDLDVASVRRDPIVIERLEITAPQIFAEVHKDGSSNLAELRKHLDQFVPAQRSGAGSKAKRTKQPRIRIGELVVAQGQIAVDASSLGIEERSLTLPSIRMRDVGGADGGTSEELAKDILTRLVAEATSEIARSEIQRQLHDAVGGSLDKAKGLLDKLKH